MAVAGVPLAALTGGLLLIWRYYGENEAVAVATVLAAILTIMVPLASWALPQQADNVEVPKDNIEQQVTMLAQAVRLQWKIEADIRQLRDPQPLTVRWTEADRDLMDWPDVIAPGTSKSGSKTRRLSLSGSVDQVVRAFRALPRRRLAVIGQPGAGKTGILVLLTLGLLDEWHSNEPVPVLFTVSSWNPLRQSYLDWFISHLVEEYRFLGTVAAKALIDAGRVLPILDGLDELPHASAGEALEAINRLGIDAPLVVACRSLQFAEAVRAADVLTGTAVVEVEAIEPQQAGAYLRRTTPPDDRSIRWEPVLKSLHRGAIGPLASALSTPLMVSLARTVYALDRTAEPTELLNRDLFPTQDSIEGHLIDALIPAVYRARSQRASTRSRDWEGESARRWFAFLASKLHERGTRDLTWWDLAASARSSLLNQVAVALMVAVPGGLAIGFGFGLRYGIPLGGVFGIVGWLLWGLAVLVSFRLGIARWRPSPGYVVLRVDRSFPLRATVRTWLTGAPYVALLTGTVFGLLVGVAFGVNPGLELGVVGTLSVMVGLLMIQLLAGVIADSNEALTPDLTLRGDRLAVIYRGGTLAIVGALLIALLAWQMVRLVGQQVVEYTLWIAVAALIATGMVWLLDHQWPWYQLRRTQLACRGRIPWRLMTFLRDAHRLGILRQVGSVYQFRHARLQDRLAWVAARREWAAPSVKEERH